MLLPVPLEGTYGHIAQTLPNDVNLNIVVSGGDQGKMTIVCLPRVLRILRMLKAHNPEYANVRVLSSSSFYNALLQVTINEAFQFSEQAVHFTSAEKRPLDSLITQNEDDPSLLRLDECHPRVVQDVAGDNQGIKGQGWQHYKLKKVSRIFYHNEQFIS